MSKGPKRKYSTEFKLDVVDRIQCGEMSPADASRKYGINQSLVCQWRDLYDRGLLEPNVYESMSEKTLRVENRLLKEKLAELFMKLEHLKKLELYGQRKRSVSTSVITAENLDQYKKPVKS